MVLIQDKDAMSINPPQYEDVMGPQGVPPPRSQVPLSQADATPVREVSTTVSMPAPTVPPQAGPYPPTQMPIPQMGPYMQQNPQVILNPEAQIGYNYQHERECLLI